MSEEEEKKLSVKAVRNYIIKTVVGGLILTFLGSFTTSVAFYYRTNNSIENLINNDVKQEQKIANMGEILENMNQKLFSTNTVTAVSDERVDGMETQLQEVQKEISAVQKTQIDILKILGDIKRNQ